MRERCNRQNAGKIIFVPVAAAAVVSPKIRALLLLCEKKNRALDLPPVAVSARRELLETDF